jgi:hypothetical protein
LVGIKYALSAIKFIVIGGWIGVRDGPLEAASLVFSKTLLHKLTALRRQAIEDYRCSRHGDVCRYFENEGIHMRTTLFQAIKSFCALALLAVSAAPVLAQDVQVSVGGEIKPGVYGRVEIGNRPPPPIVYPQPVIIAPAPVVVGAPVVAVAPVYMHVPPGHAKKWSKHCYKYNACGQPVYFVKSGEYDKKRGKKHGKHGYKHDHD